VSGAGAMERLVVGRVATATGEVPALAAGWTWRDRVEHVRCRVGSFRDRYAAAPGLYAVGRPGPDSDVLVTASYKLSLDHLRRALAAMDAWILVLDTAGVNVWCAAGKGTFGTAELVRRVESSGLRQVVSHRHLVVPQLGAPGVSAHEVQRATGFRVHYGPVRAADLPAYLAAGRRATAEMRRVRFSLVDRAVLTPMEIVPALRAVALYAAAVLLLFAFDRSGPSLARAWERGAPVAGLGLVALLAGAFLAPLLLPFLPGRAFSVKGALVGVAATGGYAALVPAVHGSGAALAAFAWVFAPAASSYLALQFTGATTFTGVSGVKKELRRALPLHLAAGIAAAVLLVVHRVTTWIAG
jgi:hypothetical protein